MKLLLLFVLVSFFSFCVSAPSQVLQGSKSQRIAHQFNPEDAPTKARMAVRLKTAEDFAQAIINEDLDRVLELIEDDVSVNCPGSSAGLLPYEGEFNGRDGFLKWVHVSSIMKSTITSYRLFTELKGDLVILLADETTEVTGNSNQTVEPLPPASPSSSSSSSSSSPSSPSSSASDSPSPSPSPSPTSTSTSSAPTSRSRTQFNETCAVIFGFHPSSGRVNSITDLCNSLQEYYGLYRAGLTAFPAVPPVPHPSSSSPSHWFGSHRWSWWVTMGSFVFAGVILAAAAVALLRYRSSRRRSPLSSSYLPFASMAAGSSASSSSSSSSSAAAAQALASGATLFPRKSYYHHGQQQHPHHQGYFRHLPPHSMGGMINAQGQGHQTTTTSPNTAAAAAVGTGGGGFFPWTTRAVGDGLRLPPQRPLPGWPTTSTNYATFAS